jgi:hypothetical protein
MTHQSVTIRQPEHPVFALTTYEPTDYRRELEKTLGALPEHALARELARRLLSEVLAEQAYRAAIARRSVTGDLPPAARGSHAANHRPARAPAVVGILK